MSNTSHETRSLLRALAHRHPNAESALAALSSLEASLTLPVGTVHVVSDVHGESQKLGHILRNASGSVRPLVDHVFAELTPAERQDLLAVIYYPREAHDAISSRLAGDEERAAFARTIARRLATILSALARRYTIEDTERVFPDAYRALLRELVFSGALGRQDAYVDALLAPHLRGGGGVDLVRVLARAVRNLSVHELVVAGDLGDRGPRIDKVIQILMQQPRVSVTWGNHDASWLGACLGQEACIATVVRLSLRYGRLEQLEEGYGIPVEPLERLARACYADDPATRFKVKGEDLREPLLLARMQKAIAILQFKLEARVARDNPRFGLEKRCLLHRITDGAVDVDGTRHPLLDAHLPTVRPEDPYALSPEEQDCMARLRAAFLASPTLWEQMQWLARHGSMYVVRDDHAIFHGCLPVDASGDFWSVEVDGREHAGRELLDALGTVVRRAVREKRREDLDLLYWLWAGEASPLFGKDKMATFETYFVADEATHKETKNPYFTLIHEEGFARRVLAEFGLAGGLVVNGHVPVKLEKGESPLKRSGLAVTIDGAFSEAYGDRGYTLVLDAERTYLAQHHHFTSVADAVLRGDDIIPSVQVLRRFDPPRRVGDTARGDEIRADIDALRALVDAYRTHAIAER